MRAVAVAVAAVLLPAAALAQPTLRAGVLGSPSVGKPAPALELPYLTASGPGPTDQPFRLGAELGRVVILVFGGTVETAASEWQLLIGRVSALEGRSAVAVGVVRGPAEKIQGLASALSGALKFLVDSDSRGHRAYGLGQATKTWAAFVVGDDGKLVWSGRVDPTRDQDWAAVGEAVDRGRTARLPPGR